MVRPHKGNTSRLVVTVPVKWVSGERPYLLAWAGRPQEAIPFIRKSLRLSPVPIDTSTLVNLGGAYFQLGQYEEAVATFKKALQLYGPDHLIAHANLAVTYAVMGNEKEARRSCRSDEDRSDLLRGIYGQEVCVERSEGKA